MSAAMSTAQVLTVEDERGWREFLPARSSVFGSVEYAAIQEQHGAGEARLFALRSPRGPIAYPLLLRPVSGLPFGGRVGAGLFDAATPQYTGPFAAAAPDGDTRIAFAEALDRWCAESGIVTEFAHLHPWRARSALLDQSGVELDREIVYVDLTQDPDSLWRDSYTHACRKNVTRARREGVRIFAARDESDARELHRIYERTMDRRGARESYYFQPTYFASFLERLPENSRILLAEHDGRIVAATLYLHDETDAYSYLGGADHEAQHVRPTNAIVDEMIRWGRDRGLQRLVLGGGYAPGDGIFRFKASFSPLRAELPLYKRVHLPDAYGSLLDAWRSQHADDPEPAFFPPYRAIT
jgi:serine/alanine adding enzyme